MNFNHMNHEYKILQTDSFSSGLKKYTHSALFPRFLRPGQKREGEGTQRARIFFSSQATKLKICCPLSILISPTMKVRSLKLTVRLDEVVTRNIRIAHCFPQPRPEKRRRGDSKGRDFLQQPSSSRALQPLHILRVL